MTKEIVLNVLLMAVWQRNPQKEVLVSDQDSQYTSHEWQWFLKSHGLEGCMSRRSNCHDNVVAESFFQLLKCERIKKRFTENGKKSAAIFLITSTCFITVSVGMVETITCHRLNMKSILSMAQMCLDYPWRFTHR